MSLSQLGTSALLPAAKTQLAAAAVTKYREAVNKLKKHATAAEIQESTSVVFRDAKERALSRLQDRKSRMQTKLNPLRALHRLRDTLILRLEDGRLSDQQGGGGSSTFSLLKNKDDINKSSSPLLEKKTEAAAMENLVGGSDLLKTAVLATLGSVCKAFLCATTSVEIIGAERMVAALERSPGQGLVTVSNHVASIDDPMITAALLPPQYLLKPASLRWTLCATDRCFKNAALVPFFRAGKVLPVDRGAGVDQLGMRVASDRLQRGDWIHIFPEGTRGDGQRMLPARRGVGWLVASCAVSKEGTTLDTFKLPLIVPYVHSGMQDVVPRGAMLPRPGKDVRVLVGEPVHVEDLILHADADNWSDRKLHAAIADRVGATLYSLKAELDGLPLVAVAPQVATVELALQEENLLPLSIRDEYYERHQRWRRRWEALGLSSLAQRHVMRERKSSGSSGEDTNSKNSLHGGHLSVSSLRDFMDTLTEVSKARAKHVQQLLAKTKSDDEIESSRATSTTPLSDFAA
jgi:1-acyl-sn-glycerol-3-phosphate acyltransferase